MENDNNFTFLFNEQFEKIPFLFRFSKKRFIGALITIGVFFIAGMIFLSIFNDSAEYITTPSLDGVHTFGFNDYNYVYLILMILCFVVIALIAGWMTLAKVFENRAFKKATNLSNMIYLTERHRVELEWQEWKMNNRSY